MNQTFGALLPHLRRSGQRGFVLFSLIAGAACGQSVANSSMFGLSRDAQQSQTAEFSKHDDADPAKFTEPEREQWLVSGCLSVPQWPTGVVPDYVVVRDSVSQQITTADLDTSLRWAKNGDVWVMALCDEPGVA